MNEREGEVLAIFVCPKAGGEMQEVQKVVAIVGRGLEGDRYCTGEGSYNKGRPGNRQVTLISGDFFEGTGLEFADSRRNIVTTGVELMWLIGREFTIGSVRMRGVKYCDPCDRPSNLANTDISFRDAFWDRGGLVAEVLEGGTIHVGDTMPRPPRNT